MGNYVLREGGAQGYSIGLIAVECESLYAPPVVAVELYAYCPCRLEKAHSIKLSQPVMQTASIAQLTYSPSLSMDCTAEYVVP